MYTCAWAETEFYTGKGMLRDRHMAPQVTLNVRSKHGDNVSRAEQGNWGQGKVTKKKAYCVNVTQGVANLESAWEW